jgi:hypothetical protein
MSTHDMPTQAQTGGRSLAVTHSQPGTSSGYVVNATSRPLYPWERVPVGLGVRLDVTENLTPTGS